MALMKFLRRRGRNSDSDSTILDDSRATVVDTPTPGAAALPGNFALPVLGRKPIAEQMRILGWLFAGLLAVVVVLTFWQIRSASQGTAFVSASLAAPNDAVRAAIAGRISTAPKQADDIQLPLPSADPRH